MVSYMLTKTINNTLSTFSILICLLVPDILMVTLAQTTLVS